MREECNRQEEQAAELNFQLQERVDELMEKLNKYSAPEFKIEEVDEGPGDVQLEMLATPKSASAEAGATNVPSILQRANYLATSQHLLNVPSCTSYKRKLGAYRQDRLKK
jgi:hypothetical protein